MKTFKDSTGKEWNLVINVTTIKRIRSLTDFDPLTIVEGDAFEKLIRDPVLLVDVLYAACKPEAEEKNVTDEEFGRRMYGDTIDKATKAFMTELVDFSPNPRDRANLGAAISTTFRTMEKARDLVEEKIKEVTDEKIEQALKNAMPSSGNVLELLGSTPAPSPSEN